MTRIFAPGNKRERGFALIDALLCLFLSGVVFLLLQGNSGAERRITLKAGEQAMALITERNALDYNRMGIQHDEQ
jgi:competence protein ComGC